MKRKTTVKLAAINQSNIKRRQNLVEAIKEAERFISRAIAAVEELQGAEWVPSSTRIAAAKRSSMDLTRALVAVRKTDQ